MSQMTEQTLSDNPNEQMDDREEGEILEDGEIADEDEAPTGSSGDLKTLEQKGLNAEEKENNNRDKDIRDRDSRKREDRKSEDRNRDKDKDRRSERDRDRDRRDRYERNDRSERDRKSSSTDRDRRDNDRKTTTSSEEERRRKERDRKRRRSDEDERDDRLKDDKRKRGRDQSWTEFNAESNNRNNSFDDFPERRPFEDFDFRVPQTHGFPNTGPMLESDLNDDEDFNFDERDFEEMIQIMGNGMPFNRNINDSEKRAMMKAMVNMMKKNLNSEKLRQLDRLRDRRRPNERLPGPTGTRAPNNRPSERLTPFKQICKYFLEGKCHKGPDCPFSHDANPPKKKELCKFYLQGFCGKGEDCLFMHSEFPCKFFHTNVECYSGDNCRFSHSPLTEETREILRNYLDSGTLPDDPKPDRQHRQHSDTDKHMNRESQNHNNSNPTDSQTNSETNTNTNSSCVASESTFTPIKAVTKRHALLGDPTQDMKSSHQTWVWQQEMKELEDAYVGNKRNLFCIEKPFVMTTKPPTPRMEDDEEEIEAQIRNYYRDTMPDFEADTDHRQPQQVSNPIIMEEQKLIEASAHDEDLRTLVMRPRTQTNESLSNSHINDFDEKSPQTLVVNEDSETSEVSQTLPKVALDMYRKMQNKVHNESDVKPIECQSDSDDDDKNVLAAALKNVQQSSKQSPTDKISQMLSIIRNSSNPSASQSPKQSEFWQNLMSGITMTGVPASPSSNTTPPRNEFRDPRLKRGKESSSSPSVEKTPPVKICDPNVKIEYKLIPMSGPDIDYSTYVSIYRIDARLKNDPRLQKFFSKLPTSEIDSLSRIVPPPLKTAPVTPLCVLKSMQKAEKERQKDMRDKTDSPTLPPLPPLTISPTKSAPTPGIRPPTPPPIMSPLELISSSIKSSNNLFRL